MAQMEHPKALMPTHGPKGGSEGPFCVPTSPSKDPRALMCTDGPKGGSKGLDVYPLPKRTIQGP